jgi:sulfide:quinone oxidoreductase
MHGTRRVNDWLGSRVGVWHAFVPAARYGAIATVQFLPSSVCSRFVGLRRATVRTMRVVVLGAGFGGLELTARLSAEVAADVEVVLIDQSDGFVFGFSKLDVMFGRALPATVRHPYHGLVKPGVRFVQTTVRSIDPAAKRVETDAGSFDADVLVVALGAELHPDATPGLLAGGHEFYTESGAFALRDVLAGFGGGRVIIGVTSTPFKCPPAPSETALLIEDQLVERGLRDISQVSLVMPMGVPIPPSPAASQALLVAFAERGIDWHPGRLVRALDPDRRLALLDDGGELPYDLFLGVPVHRAPAVVQQSGLTVDGWIPVDPLTLETSFPDVYAVGDVTSVGTPKAGVFAEGQAAVVADRIIARVRGVAPTAQYDGQGMCYLEFGRDQVARVDVTFVSGAAPSGAIEGPSPELVADKVEFGASRIRRWFDRVWSADLATQPTD